MVIQILNFAIGSNLIQIHQYVIEKYVTPRFGVVTGDLRYDPRADINNDGVIDTKDVGEFSKDAQLTFRTFGITPLLWWQVVVPLGLGLVGVAAVAIFFRKR